MAEAATSIDAKIVFIVIFLSSFSFYFILLILPIASPFIVLQSLARFFFGKNRVLILFVSSLAQLKLIQN